MDMIGKVRRMKLRDQLSDGEICRRTGLARNTVKKWLKAPGDITPKYERKKADGKLTPFVPVLEQALRTDGHRAKHARRSGRALFAQIQAQGYRGGYSAVTDFIRAWREESVKDPTKAFVPLSFELGEHSVRLSEEGLLVIIYRMQVAHEAVRQRGVLAGGLPQPGPRDAVRCPHALVRGAGRRGPPGHLRQHEDGGGQGQEGQGPRGQRPLCRHVRALPVRCGLLQPRQRLGEGARGEGRAGQSQAHLD